MSLSGVDVKAIVHELQEKIVGSWIVNIYHLPSGIFLFKLRRSQEGLQFLLIEPGKRIHLSQFNRVMPSEPSNFCKTLRKHLRDRRINSVEQRDLDRIVILNIGPDQGFDVVIELFGHGNVITVSPEKKIINALHYRKMKDRDIHPGREFRHMPPVDRDILRNGCDDLEPILQSVDKLVPALNTWLGLGPYYSRYILKQCGIDKKKSEDLDADEIIKIIEAAENIELRLRNNDFQPVVYLDKERVELDEDLEDEDGIETEFDDQWSELPFNPEDVITILPWHQKDEEYYEPDSLNEALDIFYSSQETEEDISGETEELSTVNDRLTNQLTQQLAHQQKLRLEAEQYRGDADALYENFQPATDLISTVYNARRNKMAWEEIENRLQIGKEKGIASALLFKELLIKEAAMMLDLPNMGAQRVVKVDFRKSLNENANLFYEKAKKNEKKAKNADIAIERTREKLKAAQEDSEKLKQKVVDMDTVLKRRKSWYEKFHWTHASNGMLIIAGLDASTNERIVKTYLEDDDMFLHADIQGAAATIIKTNGREVSEDTLRTASVLSVSYSSAWKLKRPMADAYAVTKEQVSMSAPSGQFLPKGGFMIYGNRTYIKDVSLKIYIGMIIEKHWARVVMSTTNQIDKASLILELIPGDEQRGSIAKQVKRAMLKNAEDQDLNKIKTIELSEIAKIIPGPSKIANISIIGE
ncbi:MAG: NFACT family protein [Candidatus Heimdallarchaeota archaeon]|nr:NFACT family protein [Candidatus Heimdallarchaeota archaeon]